MTRAQTTWFIANEAIVRVLPGKTKKDYSFFYLLNHVHEIYVHKERRYLFDKLPSSNVNYCFVDILAFCNENCEFWVIFDFEKLQVMQLIYYRYGKKILLIILKNKIVYIVKRCNLFKFEFHNLFQLLGINNLHIEQCYKYVIENTTLELRLGLLLIFVLPHKTCNIQKQVKTVSAISKFRARH